MEQAFAPLLRIGCIVEGQGETKALPVLIRRIARDVDPSARVNIAFVQRVTKHTLVRERQLENFVELVARRIGRPGGIVIVIDSDDDCPATLGPRLRERAIQARGDLPIALALATQEFEAWFLAAAESLRGQYGLPIELLPPVAPEAIRNAKGWLNDRMRGEHYSPTRHQAALAGLIDLQAARRADSFDKCYREVASLIASLRNDAGIS